MLCSCKEGTGDRGQRTEDRGQEKLCMYFFGVEILHFVQDDVKEETYSSVIKEESYSSVILKVAKRN